MYGDVGFFEGLSLFGWIGVMIWVALPILILTKQHWFFNYYERKPQASIFDEYCYSSERMIGFMAIRFVIIVLFSLGVGKLLTMI